FPVHPRTGRRRAGRAAGASRRVARGAARGRRARPRHHPPRPRPPCPLTSTHIATFLGSVWWMMVSLGVLVTFHEFGHFWVARRSGVRVRRFSVGFGRPLCKRVGLDGTEFVVAALPHGGYVRMLDERDGDVAVAELDSAFNRKSVWQRIAI